MQTVRKEDHTFYHFSKRVLDLFISIAGLMIFAPLILIVCFIILVDDFGPVLYKAVRIGQFGKPFRMFKFRTMIKNADKAGPSSASLSDNRITRTGKLLRKYKIDELPQLLNVLKGEMSIVGPRPEEKKFIDLYSESEKIILSVKPGITDWASIWNSNEGEVLEGSNDPDQTYMDQIRPKKIQLQLKYVNNCNFFIDLKILFLTLRKLLLGNTAN